jgi:hypothetical protein
MSGANNDDIGPSRRWDATLSRVCSMIRREDFDERHILPRSSRENSWGQELINNDRVHSVRVPRG